MKRSFPSKEKAMVKPTREVYLFPGVSTKLFECRRDKHDSVYLCGRCSRKITEEDIVDHVTDLNHQKMRRVVVNVGEKTYNNISKQSFYTALHTLKAFNLQRNSLNIRTSASKPSSARPGNASAALHVQHVGSTVDNFEVVDQERNSPADRVRHMPMTKRVQVPSSEAQTKTFMKLSMSAGSFHHYQSYNFGKRALNVPPKGSHVVRLLPYSRGNGSKDVTPSAICKKAAIPPKMKRSAVISPSMPTISKCIKTSSPRMGTNSSATFSRMASTSKIVPMSRTLEGERTATEAKSASFNAARATGLHEATCRTDALSRHKNAPRSTAANTSTIFQTKLTSVATPKGPKPGSENANASKNAHMENSLKANATIGQHANKGNPPAVPHLKTTLPAAFEHKRQHKEPSHTSAGTKQSGNHPKVGLNQLIIVSWEGKQQVYCQLCSVRLKRSDHPLSLSHQYNYVKMKYPGWTSTQAELESKLKNIVAHLAEVEKNLGPQNAQKVEVKKDVYQKLALLPENEAVERVKVLVRPRDPRVTFSSSEDTAEVVRREVTSPCEVSSSDDGIVQSKTGLPTNNRSEQEDKNQHRTPLTQIADVESSSKEKENLTADQLIEDPPASDLIQSPFQSCTSFSQVTPDSTPSPDIQVKTITDTVQQIQSYAEIQPQVNVTHATKSHGVTVEKSGPTSQRPQKYLESEEKSSPGQTSSRNLQAPKHSLSPGNLSASQTLTGTSVGKKAKGCSNLSFYLKASQQDNKAVIGMGSVWECRGNSLKTFYLCECCEKILSRCDICQHMVSFDHQFRYVWKEHPDILQKFWFEEDVPHFMKMEIFLEIVVHELSKREHFFKVDAQCILLESEWHEVVRTVPISKALQIVQSIRNEEKPSFFHRPLFATEQKSRHHEDQQRDDRSLPIERLSAQAHKTNQRRNSVAGQGRDRMYTVAGLEVKGASSHLDRSYSPVKAESVSPVPTVGTCFTPQDTCSGLSLQPELKPAVSQFTKSDPLVHVKKEVAFESASLATISSTISRNPEAAPRNECPLSRKRPADTSEDPLPAKYISSPVQVKTEPSFQSASDFSSVNPAPGGYGTYQTANYTVKQMYSQQSHGHYLATGISPPWESLETQQEQKYCHYWASRSQSNH